MTEDQSTRRFTGWHMTAILVGFFAVVVAVNFTMARLAMTSFGGKVVENSYVASQHYNEWLARARAQDALGWEERIGLDPDRHVRVEIRRAGARLDGLQPDATVSHPLGRTPAVALGFAAAADGTLRSATALPPGRWRLDLSVRHGGDEARYRVDLQ